MAAFHAIQPVPLSFHAGSTGKWLFTIWAGGGAVLVLPWVLYRLVKLRDVTPALLWLGGLICSLAEPMLDLIGHLWYPRNLPGPAFKGFDLSVPLLIPPCYTFFVSGMGYIAYRQFAKGGMTVRKVFLLWLAISSTDLALEIPGVSANVYKYYGKEPFTIFNFPLHWGWMNGTSFLCVGFLLWLLVPRLQGARKILLLLATTLAFTASYGIVGWPAFLALNWKMSFFAMHLVDLGSLALALLVVYGIALVVTQWQTVAVPQAFPADTREPERVGVPVPRVVAPV
jgi:hypothetical protein